MNKSQNSFNTRSSFNTPNGKVYYYSLKKLSKSGFKHIENLPYSMKILLENLLRNEDGKIVTPDLIEKIATFDPSRKMRNEIPFYPARIILQDFTGVPALVDLAAMRDAAKIKYGDTKHVDIKIPVDLVVDHSVQIDSYGSKESFDVNLKKEFERNHTRYKFLKWGQNNLENFRVIPPGTGIIHQINLEYLSKVIVVAKKDNDVIAYCDSVLGLDSHTTTINSLGILGWGVGGIEAEAVMLGMPYYFLKPEVIGLKIIGDLEKNVTATDLVITITQLLRKKGVVGKFVEFFGHGAAKLSLEDRSTISNMAPEYGATIGFFPVDENTLKYLKTTGRSKSHISFVEKYTKTQLLFRQKQSKNICYSEIIEFDISQVKPCVAGPKRPQDRIPLDLMKQAFKNGYGLNNQFKEKKKIIDNEPEIKEKSSTLSGLTDGSIIIAAIASCTNTSNPSLMIGAGLIAKKAVRLGLCVKPWVKTSFSPGSKTVYDYLKKTNLLHYLEVLNFDIVAFGCATCIGNSGPIDNNIIEKITKYNLSCASVTSGNRNFEGRISPYTKYNFLASPLLVIAYAISGTLNIDFNSEPLGKSKSGQLIFLKDIWPDLKEIKKLVKESVVQKIFKKNYNQIYDGESNWQQLSDKKNSFYSWDKNSTYIRKPPFFDKINKKTSNSFNIKNARVLALLGDSVTTDHISPAGNISEKPAAGQYLISKKINACNFNSFGSRRGNHEIMVRGTFGNDKLINLLIANQNGGFTNYFPENKICEIFEASVKYQETNTPLIIITGNEYGTGSSRDWAAKGTYLLGVKVVIAQSFERIHRSNLICMGILPLEFLPDENYKTIDLKGDEFFDIDIKKENLKPNATISVTVKNNNKQTSFKALLRIDTQNELTYFNHGGILPYILKNL